MITVQAGDGLDGSGVWNANEARHAGLAPKGVRKRLVERPAWGTDDTKIPVHLIVRLSDSQDLWIEE